MDARITLENVSYTYDEASEPALKNVSLQIMPGEFVAVLGHNGSGKSTLAKLLNALYIPTEGVVTVCGMDTHKEENVLPIRQRAGMIFQNPDNQIVSSVVKEDVAFGLENQGLPAEQARKKARAALEALHIGALAGRTPLKLSGGEKRMAALATVLALEPTLLALDEPTAFLDPRARRTLINCLKGLDTAMLIATHDLPFAAQVCPRAVLLREGRVFADGPCRELLYDPALMEACGVEAIGADG